MPSKLGYHASARNDNAQKSRSGVMTRQSRPRSMLAVGDKFLDRPAWPQW